MAHGLRIQHCHCSGLGCCCGSGSILGLGNFHIPQVWPKQEKKKKRKRKKEKKRNKIKKGNICLPVSQHWNRVAAGLRDPAHGKVRRVPHLYDFPQTPITPFFILFYCLFKATPEAYGNSQARGPVRAAAASLCHSHSNSRSEPCLRPTPQRTQRWILNPLSGARDQTCILMDTSWVR